jgi:thiamine monophosphate synthase
LRAQDGGGLDYLVFGTVFKTDSKPGLGAAGVDALAEVAAATSLPVLAIGGVTHATLQHVQQAGAAGFAAIGLFSDCAVDQLRPSIQEVSLLFDTSRGRSLT